MTDTASMATGLDTAEAASLISDLITDDLTVGDQTQSQQAQQGQDEKAPAGDGQGDEGNEPTEETRSEDNDGEGADDGSKEGEEGEEPQQDEEGDDAPPAMPKTATVKIDGKEVEVPFEEVIAGYQRQADYTRKTQAHAQEVQAFSEVRAQHEVERQAVADERGKYKVLLNQLQTALDQLYPKEPDWQELYARDKNEFLLARDNWREYQAQKAAAAAEVERVQELELGEQTKALKAQIARGQQQLVAWEPRWQDPKVLREDFAKTVDYAKNVLGYTDTELQHANDHRALYAVDKARRYDELMAKAKAIKQQAAKQTGTKKVLPAGSANRTAGVQQTRSKQNGMQRLVKGGGRVEDAAALLSNMDL